LRGNPTRFALTRTTKGYREGTKSAKE
jgi:hypothetical protein